MKFRCDPQFRDCYSQEQLDEFYNQFDQHVHMFVNEARKTGKKIINFVMNEKTKSGVTVSAFNGMCYGGISFEVSFKRIDNALNIICIEHYNDDNILECFIENEKFITNSSVRFSLNTQRIFS